MSKLRTDLTRAFLNNDTNAVLQTLKHEIKISKRHLELEFFTGHSIEVWNKKLDTSITIGEFRVLLAFFNVEATVDGDEISATPDILEQGFASVKAEYRIDLEFNTQFWAQHDIVFDECLLREARPTTSVMGCFDQIAETVIGQDEALQQLLYFVHTNLKIIRHNEMAALPIPKKNILIQGGTGTGKTFTVERLAKAVGLPLVSFNCSELTQSGYVGKDIDDIVAALQEHSYRPQILFLDEFDKLCVMNGDKNNVNTFGGQKSLLKLLESGVIKPDVYNQNKQGLEEIDTGNVIIILGGSFAVFEEKLKLEAGKKVIGFGTNDSVKKEITISEQDLIESGIIPEIAGRIGKVIRLNKLSDEALRRILLTSKESVLKQFKMLAFYDDKEFDLSETQVKKIIEDSQKLNLGVRGLLTLTEKIFVDKMLK